MAEYSPGVDSDSTGVAAVAVVKTKDEAKPSKYKVFDWHYDLS